MVCVTPFRGWFGGVCTRVGSTYVWEWAPRALLSVIPRWRTGKSFHIKQMLLELQELHNIIGENINKKINIGI